jgi:hypothetical protein
MRKFILLLVSELLLGFTLWAQSSADSIIMNERSIDRPITLHKGQVRIEGAYTLAAVTRRFDGNGDVVKLRDEGKSYVRHEWFVDIKYGIFENLHINLATQYKSQAQRMEQVYVVNYFDFTEIFEIRKKTGIEDLLVAISGRAPFTPKTLDLVLTSGIFLPLGNDEDDKPRHSFEAAEDRNRITYRYNKHWGSGAPILTTGATVKVRGKYSAITGSAWYNHPLSESENVRWQHQLVNNSFQYRSLRYKYQLPNTLGLQLEYERQLSPWFDLSLVVYTERTKGGWEEISEEKVSNPALGFLSFNPGYELLITPKIWLRQRLVVPISGKSIEAPFSIHTSLVYNFFPFN